MAGPVAASRRIWYPIPHETSSRKLSFAGGMAGIAVPKTSLPAARRLERRRIVEDPGAREGARAAGLPAARVPAGRVGGPDHGARRTRDRAGELVAALRSPDRSIRRASLPG